MHDQPLDQILDDLIAGKTPLTREQLQPRIKDTYDRILAGGMKDRDRKALLAQHRAYTEALAKLNKGSTPAASADSTDHVQHVLAAIQAHGGDHNLASLVKVREHLSQAGLTTRQQQDAAIEQARHKELVSGSAIEGREGVSEAQRAAAIADPGTDGRIGYLSARSHYLAGGGEVSSGDPDAFHLSSSDTIPHLAGGSAAQIPLASVHPAQHVVDIIRQSGGKVHGSKVRAYLSRQGITDVAAQDAAISQATAMLGIKKSVAPPTTPVPATPVSSNPPAATSVSDPAGGKTYLPAFLSTPTPTMPPPPPEWSPDLMKMAPAQAMKRVMERLISRGASPGQAHAAGAKVATYVDDYSTHVPNVYQRVLRNVYNRTEDETRAMEAARSAAARAQLLAAGGQTHDDEQADYQPQGTDTQPAKIPPGSFVVNRESAEANKGTLDAMGAATVPNQPGQVADFTGQQGSDADAAELTPGEEVIPPGEVAAHPGVAEAINQAHGPVKHLAAGTPGSAPPTTPAPAGNTTPVLVQIVGPSPLPVVMAPGATPPPGTPPGLQKTAPAGQTKPEEKPPAFGKVMGDDLARTMGGFRAFGDVFKGLNTSITRTFGMLEAKFSTVTASSTVLGRDLSGSMQLFNASLAQLTVKPVLLISHAFQDASVAIRQMDPALRNTIGNWLVFGGATLGGTVALRKIGGMITGVLVPALGALKTASLFLLTNPFGLAAAGLGLLVATKPEALQPLWESLKGLGAAVNDLAGSGLSVVNKLMVSLAGVAESVLVPALKIVVDTATVLVKMFRDIGTLLGATDGKLLTVALAAVALAGPFRGMVAGGLALVGMLNKLHPDLGAVAVVAGVATYAVRALWVAMAANPLGALFTAIGLVTGAVLGMSGAFSVVGETVADARGKIEELKTLLDKLKGGGKPTITNVGDVLSAEEKKAYAASKTEEERRNVIQGAHDRLQGLQQKSGFGTATRDQLERAGLGVSGAVSTPIYGQTIGKEEQEKFKKAHPEKNFLGMSTFNADSYRFFARLQEIDRVLSSTGMARPEVMSSINALMSSKETGGQAGKALGKEQLTPEDIKVVVDTVTKRPLERMSSLEILKAALGRGIEAPGKEGGGAEKFPAQDDATKKMEEAVKKFGGPLGFGPKSPAGTVGLPSLSTAVNAIGLGGVFDKLLGTKFGEAGALKLKSAAPNPYLKSQYHGMQAQTIAPEDLRRAVQNTNLNADPYSRELASIEMEIVKLRETDDAKLSSLIEVIRSIWRR